MDTWHSLWPQKVTGSLEVSDLIYDPKGHGDLCGRFDLVHETIRLLMKDHRDLLHDPKGYGDICGRFYLVYNPKGHRVIRGRRDPL